MQNTATNLADFINSHYSIRERKSLLTHQKSKLVIRFKLRYALYKSNPIKTIYVRLRVNGTTCTDFSTGIRIEATQWNSTFMKIDGDSDKVEAQNTFLRQIETDLLNLHTDLIRKGVKPTAQMLRDLYANIRFHDSEAARLLTYTRKFFEYHISSIDWGTAKGLKSQVQVLEDYLTQTNQLTANLTTVNPGWLMNYHKHLTTVRKVGLDRARRCVALVSRVLDFAVVNNALESNPLKSIKFPRSKVKPIFFLEESDIQKLEEYQHFSQRLQKTVDCFLMQIYTGMAYVDLLNFDAKKHLKREKDGTEWIIINRAKTGSIAQIPVVEKTKLLLVKYSYQMPVMTNQKMNEYIKEAAQIAEIEVAQRIGTHTARRTAGTFLLNRGIPLHTVSKILGHKSIKVTESHYAHLMTSTIKAHMKSVGLL
ncbi:site-specific integrase [Runella sp. SP2]|uniref:site-specific integrase n=1 Tax=Runella sp. SP2 TaxID=2268026 RepID=UPI000F08DC2A|nr:site-specific integrase [Runella sp. SP2]AYQ32318.1 hypothetical protein DTQ70_09060 [Runella sp. SP2]